MGSIANYDPECTAMARVLPVKTQCLPYTEIPHTTRLFADYISASPQIQQFYPRTPNFTEWLAQETPGIVLTCNAALTSATSWSVSTVFGVRPRKHSRTSRAFARELPPR